MRKETSSNSQNQRELVRACVLNDALARIGLRWKMQVLFSIHEGAESFSVLKRRMPGVSDQILGKRLRELTEEGLILKRDTDAAGARRTHYATSPRGVSLLQIMQSICDWETAEKKSRTT